MKENYKMKTSIFFILTIILCIGFITSAQPEICVDFDSPSAPSSLEITSSGTTITLTWGAATDSPDCSGIDYYVIVKDNSIIGDTESLTFTDSGSYGATYSYSVYAVDLAGHEGEARKNNFTLSEKTTTTNSNHHGGGGTGEIIYSANGSSANSYVCSERWVCWKWNNCTNGTQTRNCTDLNSCGTTNKKPATSQECESERVKPRGLFGITGGAAADFVKSGTGISVIGGFAIITAFMIIFLSIRKKRFAKKGEEVK